LIVPVVTSQNGYVAGYVYLPMLFLLAVACICLFIIGFAFLLRESMTGLYFLIAMLTLPAGFFGSALTAKYLEVGAYQEDPIRPIVAPIANKVLFKKDAHHEEIERFWTHVIGYPTDDRGGHWSHPGVGGAFRSESEDGHEVIVFSFRPEATEDEKNDVRERIRNYTPVYRFLENVGTTRIETPDIKIDTSNTKKVFERSPR
jgi:hypothetical protein